MLAAAAAALSSPHPCCVANSQVTVASVLFCVIVLLSLLRQFWCLQYKAIYDWLRSDMFFCVKWDLKCQLSQ